MTDLRAELECLRREVRELKDRQEIRDCVNRYCRGLDRLDPDLLARAYHPEAMDRHGPFIGKRDEFVDWAIKLCEPFDVVHHSLTTHNCEIEGDTAYAESYCIFFAATPDSDRLAAGGARYIDQLERIDGTWAIISRCEILDCCFEVTKSDAFGGAWVEVKGRKDREDLSYRRPLVLPRPL
jgi:hypothetical protein